MSSVHYSRPLRQNLEPLSNTVLIEQLLTLTFADQQGIGVTLHVVRKYVDRVGHPLDIVQRSVDLEVEG